MISQRTKAALQAARARGKKLGWAIPARLEEQTRATRQGNAGNRAAADKFASNVRPVVRDIEAAGIKTLKGIAAWDFISMQNLLRVEKILRCIPMGAYSPIARYSPRASSPDTAELATQNPVGLLLHPAVQKKGMHITTRTESEAERVLAHVLIVLEVDDIYRQKPLSNRNLLALQLNFEQQIHNQPVRKELLPKGAFFTSTGTVGLARGRMTTDGGGIDPAVRDRITERIDAFNEALADADNDPSADAQDRLRDAADELMRAIAAVMLEVGKQPSP
jgi:hypothetical protein